MKIDVCFMPGEIAAGELQGRAAVVIDVLRATSTITEALANGARAVFPVPNIDEAVRLAQNIGREQVLLCGERRGIRIEGFDLGNSPAEFTAERVAGKSLVMTTTNGTPALLASASARRILIASFLNLGAVVETLATGEDEAVTIICSGREKRFSLDDAVCAGALVTGLREHLGREAVEMNDAAYTAALAARARMDALERLLGRTAAGRQLIEAGLGEDLAFCAQLDRHAIVPHFRDRQVTL